MVKNAIKVVKMFIYSSKVLNYKKLKIRAPSMVGIDRIREYFAASYFLKSKNNEPLIAVPDLDRPDIKLNVWNKPITIAWFAVMSEFKYFFCLVFSDI